MAGKESEELCLAGPEDQSLVCHPFNRLRGSSAHLWSQVVTKVLHALSTGQPGTIPCEFQPFCLQTLDQYNQATVQENYCGRSVRTSAPLANGLERIPATPQSQY